MKLLRASPDQFVFHVGTRERGMLGEVLRMYPLVPPAHHRLAAQGQPAGDDTQRLLDEALAEQRRESREKVRVMLAAPGRFRELAHGFELTLTPEQMEWLLQVLNDVRVGCWLQLGEPDDVELPPLEKPAALHWVTMEFCGLWESLLLAALGVEQSPQWR